MTTATNGKRKARAVGKPPAHDDQQRAAAEAELHRHAAEWVGAIRTVLTALTQEVAAASDGTLLGSMIDGVTLNDVYCDLYNADCAACNLSVIGYELPVPNLLAARDRICSQQPSEGGA